MLQCKEAVHIRQASSVQALCTLGGKAEVILPGHSEETSHTSKKEIQRREEENQGVSTLEPQDAWGRLQTLWILPHSVHWLLLQASQKRQLWDITVL